MENKLDHLVCNENLNNFLSNKLKPSESPSNQYLSQNTHHNMDKPLREKKEQRRSELTKVKRFSMLLSLLEEDKLKKKSIKQSHKQKQTERDLLNHQLNRTKVEFFSFNILSKNMNKQEYHITDLEGKSYFTYNPKVMKLLSNTKFNILSFFNQNKTKNAEKALNSKSNGKLNKRDRFEICCNGILARQKKYINKRSDMFFAFLDTVNLQKEKKTGSLSLLANNGIDANRDSQQTNSNKVSVKVFSKAFPKNLNIKRASRKMTSSSNTPINGMSSFAWKQN